MMQVSYIGIQVIRIQPTLNYLQGFDIKTKELLFKRRIDIGGVNNNFKGDFQEAEGLDMITI